MADIRVGRQVASRYDEYVIEGGSMTKQELLHAVKNRPCAICGKQYHHVAMDFYHVLDNKSFSMTAAMRNNVTLYDLVNEIEKCAVVCANCHRMIVHKVIYPPKVPITLDGNFWSSVDR
jgi:hypothetical protein